GGARGTDVRQPGCRRRRREESGRRRRQPRPGSAGSRVHVRLVLLRSGRTPLGGLLDGSRERMKTGSDAGEAARGSPWMGRVLTAVTAAFLFFDSTVKVLGLPVAVEGTIRLGYPSGLVVSLGVVELVCLAAYLYSRTAVLGAILLTGFLGG